MAKGFMRISRDIENWGWYRDSNTFRIFFHLMLKAQYQDGNDYLGIKLERGQVVIGRKKLSVDLGISEQSVRTSLERLSKSQEITIQSTNRYSIITICKYDSWQGLELSTNQQTNQQLTNGNTENQPTTNHIQEINKDNKEDINNTLYNPPSGDESEVLAKLAEMEKAFAELSEENRKLREDNDALKKKKAKKEKQAAFDVRADLSYVADYPEIWNEWLDYKDKIGKQYKTQNGAQKEYKGFVKTANGSKAKAQAIIDQSVKNSWQGLFDVKDWIEQSEEKDPWIPNLEKYEPAELEYNPRLDAYMIPNKYPICNHDWPYTPENRPDGARVCNGSDVWVWNAEQKIWREDR